MVSKVRSLGLTGIGGYEVSVECFLSPGLPGFDVVGLPDAAVKEARERVRAAIKNSGMSFPVSKLTVNLAPADTKKAGTVYDLPVLLTILIASGHIDPMPEDTAFFGELSLTGDLRPVPGTLPMALAARRAGITKLFVPEDNAREASYAEGVTVYGAANVPKLLEHLRGVNPIAPTVPGEIRQDYTGVPDFAEVKGQENVKRALEIAAAGGHNILMVGPPGAGKSMLSKRLPGILPEMTAAEILESTEIHSVMGFTSKENPIISRRPFRSPHHSISPNAMSGGGPSLRPGEISLAHNGVLFMDELPEFRRDVMEALRQPIEDGKVSISRVSGFATYPSRFMLVCAMNPCKCGWYGHPSKRCRCTDAEIRRYHSRVSGPLLDRIDLLVEVPSLEFDELSRRPDAETSADIRARVFTARGIQLKRFGDGGEVRCNAYMSQSELNNFCTLSPESESLMRRAFDNLALTARSYDRVLRVARTIADLAGEPELLPTHIAEAVQYRTYDFRDQEQ